MKDQDRPIAWQDLLRKGCVIPAHPLALQADRTFSEKHQRGLARYYCDAGAGGIAVGVHATQFEIRDPKIGLYRPVLALAAESVDAYSAKTGRPMLKIAGVAGRTAQAEREAELATSLGYHACLLALKDMAGEPVDRLIEHCRAVANVMPLVGFYLQAAAGGGPLPLDFWRRFVTIDNVVAIKIAPFNRYQTFDVVRAVCEAGRENDIALYTGNDDTIVFDLLSEYRIISGTVPHRVRFAGGLLGHWGVWTRSAVELFERIQTLRNSKEPLPPDLLTLAQEVTDANAAFFDPAHGFAGCLSGINEVLYRRGQLPSPVCLNPRECLSPGQAGEIDRVHAAYPHLNDDAFVAEHLDAWLS